MDHAKRGADALSAGQYSEAIQAYSLAIAASPSSPDYYIKRSTAYQRSSPPDFVSAFSDAETAVVLAQKRAKRESIVQAQLRRAIALFGLERYADAGFVLDVVKRMDPKEKTLAIWENKIKGKLAVVIEQDDPRRTVVVEETPDLDLSRAAGKISKQASTSNTPPSNGNSSATTPALTTETAAPTQTPANKIRHDWYQNSENVYFTLLAKGVPKDKAMIDIQERSLAISFPLITSSTFEYSLEPLFAPVDVSKSSYSIFSTKVEVTLKKAQPGRKWHALESSEPISEATTAPSISTQLLQPSVQATAPSYPTSSRSGPKNWDKLAADLTAKKPTPDSTKGAQDDGKDDYDYDAEGGDEVNGFFKKLYAGATPDVQRAMMKSFQESNGTALSTNWDEVGKAPVKTQPPDGMEARKWDV